MHRGLAVLFGIALVALAASIPAQGLPPPGSAPPFVPGQVVVGYERDRATVARDAAAAVGAMPGPVISRIDAQILHLPDGKDPRQAAEELKKLPGIRYAEPNYRRRVLAVVRPIDPAYETIDTVIAPFDYPSEGAATYYQWALHAIEALEAWQLHPGTTYTKATKPLDGPRIAICDTGIDWGATSSLGGYAGDGVPHEDFVNDGGDASDPDDANAANGGQIDVASGRNVMYGADPAWFTDDYGHGTAVAGLAAAATKNNSTATGNHIAGLAYNARVIPVKCLNNNGEGTDIDVANGIIYAVDAGALVINLSLGDFFYSQAEQDAVDYAWTNGALVIAAAGNEGDGLNRPLYPAALDRVMAVAATRWDVDPALNDLGASYSNYGYYVTVGAPGGDYGFVPLGFWFIWSPMPTETVYAHQFGLPDGTRKYQYHMGTSLAAPHVAGLAALYASYTGITRSTPNAPLLMWKAICRGCDSILGTPGWNQELGWGRINAYHTLLEDNNRGSSVGGIRGQVKYKGTVVANATVEAVPDGGGSPLPPATSQPDGMYRVTNVTPGTYDVTATYFSENQMVEDVVVESGYDTPGIRFNIGVAPPEPSLAWVGSGGYSSDGCDPNSGNPSDIFTFKAKYTDPSGDPPLKARLIVAKRVCKEWRLFRNVALTKESGDIATGAIYSATVDMPNLIYKHRFLFTAADGSSVAGPPNTYKQLPQIEGRPSLCWAEKPGFETDGVDPDSGPVKSKFKFVVLYQDSAGDVPSTHEVVVRRDGAGYKAKSMSTSASGNYRLIKYYITSLWISDPGTYEYRFRFADDDGYATGDPATWQSGPIITESSGMVLTGLAALPTARGGQITFTLSDAADVTATVVNVAGRPIRVVATDTPFEAGTQTLLWDGRSANGLPVPSGLYLIRVTARQADGGQASALATLALR